MAIDRYPGYRLQKPSLTGTTHCSGSPLASDETAIVNRKVFRRRRRRPRRHRNRPPSRRCSRRLLLRWGYGGSAERRPRRPRAVPVHPRHRGRSAPVVRPKLRRSPAPTNAILGTPVMGAETCILCGATDKVQNLGMWLVADERRPVHLDCWLAAYGSGGLSPRDVRPGPAY